MRHRSFLITPATRLDRVQKAMASGADWVVIDLEDGVAPEDKDRARDDLFAAFPRSHQLGVGLRINALGTQAGLRDLSALMDQPVWPDMIVIPKVESRREIEQIKELAREVGQSPALLATLETAHALEHAPSILVGTGPNVLAAYGSADHSAETGSSMSGPALAWARGRIVNACALAGVPAIDGVCLEFRDTDKLAAETTLIGDMGFAGKLAIHPGQIATINHVLTPSEEETRRARAMIAAAAEAGGGAFSFEGKMVDPPVLAQAHRTLAAYEETP